jgi:fatty-acyl-CoA synthase
LPRPLIWPELISRHRGTCTAAPNFAYALTARVLPRASGLDLSSMRFALNGAEPIDVGAVRAFLAAGAPFGLRDTAVVPAYGMAEASLAVSFHRWGTSIEVDTVDAGALERDHRAVPVAPDTEGARRFVVLGEPLAGIEVSVRDDRGRGVGDREVGVLHLRGEAITARYLTVDGPVATQDTDGWLDTGDLGYLIDGRVVVCGRVKDVIIMGGRNIYPTDIERAAQSVAGVRAGNAAAVRLDAGERRESFAVVVESHAAGDPVESGRIADEVRSAVTSTMGVRPAAVTVVPPGALPKTPSGKIRRAAAARLVEPTGMAGASQSSP